MKRNKFSLSHYHNTTGRMGEFIPIVATEVMPGDSFRVASTAMVRLTPLATPVMQPIQIFMHHWFVPNRIIWDDFNDKFITGGLDGNDATSHPYITFGSGIPAGTLANYLARCVGSNSQNLNALFFRAYGKVCNDFVLDSDLDTQLTIDTGNGADTTTNTSLQNVSWEKDYFTTCRAWSQRGTEVTLPLGTSAPVTRVSNANAWDAYRAGTDTKESTTEAVQMAATGHLYGGTSGYNWSLDPDGGLIADLSTATAASINDLREKVALQNYKQARAKYGSLYVDYLRYLGINPADSRLQRASMLQSTTNTVQISEVLATGYDSTDAGIGALKGHGIGMARSKRMVRFFDEHGIFLTTIFIRPKTMYYQGLEKQWFRSTKEDYFQKELEHIGQDEVLNKELYADHTTPAGTFGWQNRYSEFKSIPSKVSGELASIKEDWHQGRKFTSDPTLNSTFVSANPTNRIHEDQTNDTLVIMTNHSIQARRPLSKESNPIGIL